jgi:hypothetical protein
MTPLARKFVNYKNGATAELLLNASCFECTSAFPAAIDLRASPEGGLRSWLEDQKEIIQEAFLPFPVTWLEFRLKSGTKFGYLLEQCGKDMRVTFVTLCDGVVREVESTLMPLGGSEINPGLVFTSMFSSDGGAERKLAGAHIRGWIYSLLAIINTPRCINKETNTPHRGFEKNLKQKYGRPIKLRDWHVITLRGPREIEDAVNAGATGITRALHRCRAHRRTLPSGKSTIVISHLRGDPSKGFARGDYRVLH